jgi:hypothetical protein
MEILDEEVFPEAEDITEIFYDQFYVKYGDEEGEYVQYYYFSVETVYGRYFEIKDNDPFFNPLKKLANLKDEELTLPVTIYRNDNLLSEN